MGEIHYIYTIVTKFLSQFMLSRFPVRISLDLRNLIEHYINLHGIRTYLQLLKLWHHGILWFPCQKDITFHANFEIRDQARCMIQSFTEGTSTAPRVYPKTQNFALNTHIY